MKYGRVVFAVVVGLALSGCQAGGSDATGGGGGAGGGGGGAGGGGAGNGGGGGAGPDDNPDDDIPPIEVWTPPTVLGVATLADTNPDPDIVEVTLSAVPRTQLYGGIELETFTYNGVTPGKLLQAKVGDEIIVHFNNYLPQATTVHWHGLRIPADMDGSPRIQQPVAPDGSFTYHFTVPDAGSFWYHPHVRTNEQLERGLYGPIIIHDPAQPVFDAERYLLLDDVSIEGGNFTNFDPAYDGMHGRFGNVLLTNGQPSDEVHGEAEQGQIERWRMVNTSNARTMYLEVHGATVRVIGSDGGQFFEEEFYTPDYIELPVGQRYELEVTYDTAGTVELLTYVLAVDDNGDVVEIPIPVYTVEVAASERVPAILAYPLPAPPPSRAGAQTASMFFDGVQTAEGELLWRINGQGHSMEPIFTYQEGDVVLMTLTNQVGMEHPFHLHGQFFTVLNPPMPGLRDTVLLPGMESVQILAYFTNPGRWMAHCHILEHAELGMMAEIEVEPAP